MNTDRSADVKSPGTCPLAAAVRYGLGAQAIGDRRHLAKLVRHTSTDYESELEPAALAPEEMSRWIRCLWAAVDSEPGEASPEVVVAIAVPACSIEETLAMLAIVALDHGVLVPIDVSLPVHRQIERIQQAQATQVITWLESPLVGELASLLEQSSEVLPDLSKSPLRLCCVHLPPPQLPWLQPGLDAMYVLFTSGTTNTPKAVVGTRRGAWDRLQWFLARYPVGAKGGRVMRATRLGFVDAIAEILSAVVAGAELVHLTDCSIVQSAVRSIVLDMTEATLECMRRRNITRLTVVPSVLKVLLLHASRSKCARESLQSLRMILLSGEVLPIDVVMDAQKVVPAATLLNLYGSTEVSGDILAFEVPQNATADDLILQRELGIPIGYQDDIIGENQIRINHTNEKGIGELEVSGCALAQGYLAHGQIVQPYDSVGWEIDDGNKRWFRMGDRCLVKQGKIYFCGRTDRLVKLRGNRLQLEDVEHVVRRCYVSTLCNQNEDDVTVVAHAPTRDSGVKILVVFVVCSNQTDNVCACCRLIWRSAEHYRHMNQLIVRDYGPEYVPSVIAGVFSEDMPRLQSGKYDTCGLIERFDRHMSSLTFERSNESRSTRWNQVYEIASHQLKSLQSTSTPHSPECSWLELGGNSLDAAIASFDINAHFGVQIQPHDIMRMTLDEICERIIRSEPAIRHKSVNTSDDGEVVTPKTKRQRLLRAMNEANHPLSPHKLDVQRTKVTATSNLLEWFSRRSESSHFHHDIPICVHRSVKSRPFALAFAWSYDLGKCVDASPLIVRVQTRNDDNIVDQQLLALIGSHSTIFACVKVSERNPGIENLCWKKELGERIEATASLCIRHELVLVGTYGGILHALDLHTGETRWVFSRSGPIKAAAVVIDYLDLIVLGTYDHQLCGIEAATGKLLWSLPLSGSVFSTPLFVERHKFLLCATTNGLLTACVLSGREPSVVWVQEMTSPVFSSLNYADPNETTALVGCADGRFCAVDIFSGCTLWSRSLSAPIFSSPCTYQIDQSSSFVVIGAHDGKLRKYSCADGSLCWENELDGTPIFSSPCVFKLKKQDDASPPLIRICVTTTSGGLFVCAEDSGLILFSTTQTLNNEDLGEIFSSPVIADNFCLVGTRKNKLVCFELGI